MAAPKNPNTVNANAKRARNSQDKLAATLTAAGWVCIPPEQQSNPEGNTTP